MQQNLLKKNFLTCLCLAAVVNSALAGRQESPAVEAPVRYKIDLEIGSSGALHGWQQVVWRNTSETALDAVYFYLLPYPHNLNPRTMPAARLQLDSVRTVGNQRLLVEYVAAGTGLRIDSSLARLSLLQALQPGETIELWLAFKASAIERATEAKSKPLLITNGYPKLARLGRSGWQLVPARPGFPPSLLFSNYDVTITCPDTFAVAATGDLQRQSTERGKRVVQYTARRTADFSLALVKEAGDTHERWQNVPIRLLLPKHHETQRARQVKAIQQGLAELDRWFEDLPMPPLTLIESPLPFGMADYAFAPGLVFIDRYAWLPEGARFPERTIFRQLALQRWRGQIGVDRASDGWLADGLATYTALRMLETLYGRESNLINYFGIRVAEEHKLRARYLGASRIDPVAQPASAFYDIRSREIQTRDRAALVLATAEAISGTERWHALLRRYASEWRHRHPETSDFLRLVSNTAGADLARFFDQALQTNAVLDYAITVLHSHRHDSPAAHASHGDGIAPASSNGNSTSVSDEQWQYRTIVRVRRNGTFAAPVEIQVRFADGATETALWDGAATWHEFIMVSMAPATSAIIDPGQKMLLDTDRTNNSRTAGAHLGDEKLSIRWLFFIQSLLHLLTKIAG